MCVLARIKNVGAERNRRRGSLEGVLNHIQNLGLEPSSKRGLLYGVLSNLYGILGWSPLT